MKFLSTYVLDYNSTHLTLHTQPHTWMASLSQHRNSLSEWSVAINRRAESLPCVLACLVVRACVRGWVCMCVRVCVHAFMHTFVHVHAFMRVRAFLHQYVKLVLPEFVIIDWYWVVIIDWSGTSCILVFKSYLIYIFRFVSYALVSCISTFMSSDFSGSLLRFVFHS